MINQKFVIRELNRKGGIEFAKQYDIDKMISVLDDLIYFLEQKKSSGKFAYLVDGIATLKSDPKNKRIWDMMWKALDFKEDYEDELLKVLEELKKLKKVKKTLP